MVAGSRRALIVLLAAVAIVLLIACANLSSLLLTRATARQEEMAIRLALGADRWRLGRQMLTESLVLAAAAGVVGSLIAVWSTEALKSFIPAGLPRGDQVGVDGVVLGFTFLATLVSGTVIGLAPALQSARAEVFASSGGRADVANRPSARRARGLLVVTEVALALALLVAAGLALQSFERLTREDPGFESSRRLTFSVSLPEGKYGELHSTSRFFRDLTERLAAIPGVVSVAAVQNLPLSGATFGGSFTVVGKEFPPDDEPRALVQAVTPGYFRTMGIRLLSGRDFGRGDHEEAPRVAAVSASAAAAYWPGESPLGRKVRLHVGVSAREAGEREIVGVVSDVRHDELGEAGRPTVYVPQAQYFNYEMSLVVQAGEETAPLLPLARGVLREIDPDVALADIRTVENIVSEASGAPRFRALLLGAFAVLALCLAALGLYGVVAFAVGRRTREIGVRMALGAQPGDVLRLVVVQGMMPVVAGLVLGTGLAAALARAMSSLLYGVTPADGPTFACVLLLLFLVGLGACYLPARRATRVDPVSALRDL
jgi:putative ABC transport system permease protein